jgi:hypothetical protein
MLTPGNMVEARYIDGHYYAARIVQNLSQRASGWPTPTDRFIVEFSDYANERATVAGTEIRDGLLDNWSTHHDVGSGHEYYVNDKTGESTWERPVRSYKRRRSFANDYSSPVKSMTTDTQAQTRLQVGVTIPTTTETTTASGTSNTRLPVGFTGSNYAVPRERNPYVLETVSTNKPKPSNVIRRSSFNSSHANRFASAAFNTGKSVGGKSVGLVRPRDPHEAAAARAKFEGRKVTKQQESVRPSFMDDDDALSRMMTGNFMMAGCGCANPNC